MHIIATLAVFCLSVSALTGETRAGTGADSDTQFDLNQRSEQGLANAEAELNRTYQKVRKIYSADPIFLRKLQRSQDLWKQFRDAEIEVEYPHTDKAGYYGSVYPMCVADYEAALTRERVEILKRWISGTEEGDVCAGSVRFSRGPTRNR